MIEGPEAPAARDHVIVQSPLGVRAIVRDGWKYMRPWQAPNPIPQNKKAFLSREFANPQNYEQLYHLGSDFDESSNRIADFPSVAAQLSEELRLAEANGRTAP